MDQMKGTIFDIQKYCIHDGPGIRTVVFLKGCPLSCQWCANPESQQRESQFAFFPHKCIGDQKCVQNCPQQAISFDRNGLVRDQKKCTCCGVCAKGCAAGALSVYGAEMRVEEVLEICLRDRTFYELSQGGVTLSGGEPMMQHHFALALLRELKKEGIHTAMETSGYAPAEIFCVMKEQVDLFLYDLKCIDSKKHLKFTGVENKLILDNLKTLARGKGELIIRIPVIPGFNDDPAEIDRMMTFLLMLDKKYPVNLLPYHKLGAFKYGALGMEYGMESLMPPTDGEMEAIASRFRKRCFDVKVGG